MTYDWNKLIFGAYSQSEIQNAVDDVTWQELRQSLVGQSLQYKYASLQGHLVMTDFSQRSKIQVTNYVNALKRGGLI